MAQIPQDPFILVDGSSYLFRAYHALPPLTTSKGHPTGAIVGVINMLRKLLQDYHPSKMAVVFDSKEKNFRHERFEAYKANRMVMPDELQQQILPLHAIIKAMGLPLIVIPGIEADDIIGTLAMQAKHDGLFTLISTGDKDFAQLVDDDIFLINTMSAEIYDRSKVIQKFEVPPEKIIDYLTLIGDTVDNIPGVPKVGPKTAVKWLESYENLSGIIQHAAEISGKVGENLRAALDKLPLFEELVTIQLNISMPWAPKDLVLAEPDVESLRDLYTDFEFKNLLRELEGNSVVQSKSKPKMAAHPKSNNPVLNLKEAVNQQYETVLTEAAFEAWLLRLKAADLVAFDTETTSLDYMLAEIVGVSFAITANEAAYVPFGHDYLEAPQQLSRDWVLAKLKPWLEDERCLKVGHNLKYDREVLENHGICLQGIAFDTMLEAYVLESAGNRYDMDSLAKRYLGYQTVSFEEIAGKGVKQLTFNQIPIAQAAFYAAEDADITLKLHQTLWSELSVADKQKAIFETIEMPLIPVLARMERGGVLVDTAELAKQSQELGLRLQELENNIHQMAGQEFNINSPKQLQEILYTQLKLPILEKTPTGQPSTAESVLQALAVDFALPQVILEYRSLSKLKSTYTDRLPEQVNPNTGRIHTSYHQVGTRTGRLSSSDPNLQNIPIRSVEGRKIRSAFIAPKGKKIVSADYSQIELRIMAHLSQDPTLLQAFKMGEDIHKSTAASVFGIPLNEVTHEQRQSAKAINFGLMYGMSAFGLAKQLGIKREEAEKHFQQYFACFPRVKAFMEEIDQQAKQQGYVESVLGRRLYLPDLKSPIAGLRKAALRAAINAPMQGTNADIIKLSMIRLDKWIEESKLDLKMIMQVHDELIFEVSEDLVSRVIPIIKEIMESAISMSVDLKVEIGVGDNWDKAH